jgi:peptide/nickel transport system permease protein
MIFERLGPTLELALVAMVLILIIALPLGVVSAVRQYSWMDNLSMLFVTF